MPETLPASFFVVGGTLRGDAPSYIERAADQTLYQSLQAGEICYVLTARQMGKSSLMVRTAARLRENGARVAVLDLTSLGQNLTAEQWYNGLIERAGQQFRLEDEVEDYWRRFPQLGPMRRFMRVISDAVLPVREGRVVIFVDEIDAVRSLPFSTDEFFAGIRECFNRRPSEPEIERLTFCLLGVATPSDLIRDTRTTPFNIGRRIELTDFTEQEAMPLAQGLGTEDDAGSAILRRIIYWTGGHPYLTQRLCQAVAQESAVRNVSAVDRLCRELFLSSRARDRDDNLLFVRERMLRSEVDTPGLLTIYERILDGKAVKDDETNPLISVLRLSGITRVENGVLKLRSRIYKEVFNHDWVISNMPGAEIRRQRTAYRRGLKRALAITLPLLVLGMTIVYGKLYLAQNTIAERHFESPKPPAFWASARIPVAGEMSQIGGILVRTGPDVNVLVDDVPFGRTSSSGELRIPLPPAAYSIRLEKPGFQALRFPMAVRKDQESQINAKLEREVIVATAFSLTGEVPPGATVRLDGREMGQVQPDGTFAHEASPGSHVIELEKDGYLPLRTQEVFTLGEKKVVALKMQMDPAKAETAGYAAVADSTDPSQLRQYLQKYPNGKNATQVRNRLEEIEWRNVNRTDLQSLDAFLQSYPQGQHASEAREWVAEGQKEIEAYIAAEKAGTTEALQTFLTRHPNGPHAEQARQKLSQAQDTEAVLAVLRRYEEAYNKKDLEAIVALYPSCPEGVRKAYRDSFRSPEPPKLKLDSEQLDIQGIMAIVKGKETRSGALSSTNMFTAKLVRQGDKWVIESGIY
jgi:AAA-like domain/PEGA domain